MAHLQMYSGSTQIFLNVYVKNTATGNGMTGMTASTGGLTAYYFVAGALAPVAVPLVAMSLGTWVAGGFVEVDPVKCPGLYQFGLPNVAWSGRSVTIIFQGVAGMEEVNFEIELTATNNQDSLRGGLLALPDGPTMVKRGQAVNGVTFLMVNAADGRTPMPGLTVTASVSKNGGAFDFTDNQPTEISSPLISGMYTINLTAADMNGGTLTFVFAAGGAQSTVIELWTQP